jgi:hypothetical protein
MWWSYRGEGSGCHKSVDSMISKRKVLQNSGEIAFQLLNDMIRGRWTV